MSGLLNIRCILKLRFLIVFLSYCFPSEVKFIVCHKAPAKTVNDICEFYLWRFHINVYRYKKSIACFPVVKVWIEYKSLFCSLYRPTIDFWFAIILILIREPTLIWVLFVLDIGKVLMFSIFLTSGQTISSHQSFSVVFKANFLQAQVL